jgi:hypothetical protein
MDLGKKKQYQSNDCMRLNALNGFSMLSSMADYLRKLKDAIFQLIITQDFFRS